MILGNSDVVFLLLLLKQNSDFLAAIITGFIIQYNTPLHCSSQIPPIENMYINNQINCGCSFLESAIHCMSHRLQSTIWGLLEDVIFMLLFEVIGDDTKIHCTRLYVFWITLCKCISFLWHWGNCLNVTLAFGVVQLIDFPRMCCTIFNTLFFVLGRILHS